MRILPVHGHHSVDQACIPSSAALQAEQLPPNRWADLSWPPWGCARGPMLQTALEADFGVAAESRESSYIGQRCCQAEATCEVALRMTVKLP